MGNLIPQMNDIKKIIEGVRANAERGGGDFAPILKLDQDGTWKYGMEDAPLEDGTRCMVLPSSFVHGWTCWKGGKPVDAVMGPIWEPVAEESSLPDHGPYKGSMEGWSATSGAAFVLEYGDKLRYTPMSYGGRTALGELAAAFAQRLESEENACIPLVTLESRSYYNKNYQRDVQVPVLEVVEWLTEQEAELRAAEGGNRLEAPEAKTEPVSESKLAW